MDNKETIENLHQQTAKIEWKELQRFFAQGVLLKVKEQQDLIRVAGLFVEDNKQAVNKLLEAKQVVRCSDDDARKWQKINQLLWTVVAAPWVLVQEVSQQDNQHAK